MSCDSSSAERKNHLFLFYLSFLCLFLELLLIRWVSTEIRIFSYFRNLVLISCFLGLGIGFNLKRFKTGLLSSMVLIAALALLIHPSAEIQGVSFQKIHQYLAFPEFHMWAVLGKPGLLKLAAGFAMVTVIMVLLVGVFIPFGQVLGAIFEASDNRIRDYSINLLGSLAGTWAFALLSYLNTPPLIWLLVGAGGTAACLMRAKFWRFLTALAALAVIMLLIIPETGKGLQIYWSPYHKLEYGKSSFNYGPWSVVPYKYIKVNSVVYMYMFDLSYAQADKYPGVFNRQASPYYPYDIIYRFQPEPERVLIVGAGGGNDVAAAIRNNAGRIDAVEIDPVIARLGRARHPERPYQAPRVHLYVDDARSFFKKSTGKYDLIIFGLLDSHTLTSNFTNINLDSYVYTIESIREAKSHLTRDGFLVISFFTEREWLGYKLYSVCKQVFGRPPLMMGNVDEIDARGTIGTLFINGPLDRVAERIQNDHRLLKKFLTLGIDPLAFAAAAEKAKIDVPEDDWPYLYLQKRGIPTLHLVVSAIVIALMVPAVLFLLPGRKLGPSHFLFLGAAFMLLEVHSISKVSLLFGSTWIVNVVIISAILVMVLAANLLALRSRIERVRWWYFGLFLSLAAAYLVPVNSLLFGSYLIRGLIAGAFYSLPMFFAGVIFAVSIRRVAGVEAAFAANMLGAAIGGMLESSSYMLGLKAVVILAVVLYLCSLLALRKLPIASPPET